MEKGVVNIAKYYHHKTVYMGGKEDNIYNNICKRLDITRATNYKLKDLIMLLRLAGVKIRKSRSFSKKRLFSYTNALLPLSKRIYLGFLFKGKRRPITLN